jgi:hypothetical protein
LFKFLGFLKRGVFGGGHARLFFNVYIYKRAGPGPAPTSRC